MSDRPLRVGIYTPNYPGITGEGGIGSYTRTLGYGLANLGHTVHLLAPDESGRATTTDGPLTVHFTSTRHLPLIDKLFPGAGACYRVARTMKRLVSTFELDIVEFPNWEGYGAYYMATKATPVVVRLHTSSAEAQRIDQTVSNRWYRWDVYREGWVSRHGDAVVTHSQAHRQMMMDEVGLPESRIDLIPHGIHVYPDYVRAPRTDRPPLIVFLGRMENRKGTSELLQAVPEVLAQFPTARFVLIGSDRPHAPGGRTHAAYLAQDFPAAVQKQVTLTGPLPQVEVDHYLQTADIFVAPSRYESFGLIFLEAMRWGTPVIGTTAGGIPEIIEHEQSGLLVSPQAPQELAAAICRLLRDDSLRETVGKAGRKRVEEDFSVASMARRMAELYRKLLPRAKSNQ